MQMAHLIGLTHISAASLANLLQLYVCLCLFMLRFNYAPQLEVCHAEIQIHLCGHAVGVGAGVGDADVCPNAIALSFLLIEVPLASSRWLSFLSRLIYWLIHCERLSMAIDTIHTIHTLYIYFLAPTSRLPNSPSHQKSDSLVRISDSG